MPTIFDQSAFEPNSANGISDRVAANDFTLNDSFTLQGATLVLTDIAPPADGTLDNFSGTLSWAIYADNGSGLPGTLLFSGQDTAPVLTDTGRPSAFGDIMQAEISFGTIIQLDAGTYWLAVHEGNWGSAFDGSAIAWLQSTAFLGGGRAFELNETNPVNWSVFEGDNAFSLQGIGTNIVVDNAADVDDGDYSAGNLSLREAVALANSNGDATTITFDASLAGSTITLNGSQLALTQDVTIDGDVNGDNKADITISGDGRSRIFEISGADTDAALLSLTLTNGNAIGFDGGAVFAEDAGSLLIRDTTVSESAANFGGAIYSSNTTTTIANSLISGNTAVFNGGGIYSLGDSLTLQNTTVYANTAADLGGGIILVNSSAGIFNSTISGNFADTGQGFTDSGGGLANVGNGYAVLYNSVIAGNASGDTQNDISGSLGFTGNSAIGALGTGIYGINGGGNLIGITDAGLGPLADNGGTVMTLTLQQGSVLIDAGSNGRTEKDFADLDDDGNTTEQLPVDADGGPRIGGGTADIGASEFNAPLVVTTSEDVVDANDGELSLREAVALANAGADADTIVFDADLEGHVITLNGAQLELTQDVAIDGDTNGDNKADITISGNDAVRIFNITGGNTDVDLLSLTLTDGNVGGEDGGAVLAAAIGTLDIADTTISSSAARYGGGLYANSTAVRITNSLISGNAAAYSGGGISLSNDSLVATNTTIYGNTANGLSGGIHAYSSDLTLLNSTMTGNRADADGTAPNHGGGISIFISPTYGNTITITNSVVAGNTSGMSGITSTFNDVSGTVSTATNSAFGTDVADVTGGVDGNLENVTPGQLKLGGLADNGGTVQTINVLGTQSVLVNAGSNAGAAGITTDANGGERIGDGTVDIGATEFTGPLMVTTTSDVEEANDGLLSLREAVARANAGTDADTIIFDANLAGQAVTLAGTPLALTQNVTINGDVNGDTTPDITVAVTAGGLTITGSATAASLLVAVSGGKLVTDSNTFDAKSSVVVSGAGSFTSSGSDSFAAITQSGGTIKGTSILTLSGAFTQSGGATGGTVDINAATFNQSGGATIAAGTTVTSSGAQTLQGGTIAGTLDGAGAVTVNTGTTSLTGAGAITAATAIGISSGGTLISDGNGISDAALINNAGVLTITAAETIGALRGNGTVNLTGAVLTTGNAAINTFAGTLQGAGGLTIQGAGTTELTGAISHTGTTTVNSGTLDIESFGNTRNVGDLVVNAGGKLVLDNASLNVDSLTGTGGTIAMTTVNGSADLTFGSDNSSGTFAGAITGDTSLTALIKEGTGTTSLLGNLATQGLLAVNAGTLILSGNNTIAGGIFLDGTLRLESDTAAGGAGGHITTTGSIIDYAEGLNIATGVTIASGTTRFNVITGAAEQSGNIDEDAAGLPLEKTGAGALLLSGTNSFGGDLTITGGTLAVTGGAAIGDAVEVVVSTGATFRVDADEGIGALTSAAAGAAVNIGANELDILGAQNTTFAGSVAGDGSLINGGTATLTLTGNGSGFSGVIGATNAGAQLAITGGGTTGASGVGSTAGATFRTDGGAFLTSNVVVSADGQVTFTGSEVIGTLTNGGANGIATGTVTLTGAGTILTVNGSSNALNPGNFNGTAGTIGGTGTLNISGGTFSVSAAGNVAVNTIVGATGTLTTDSDSLAAGVTLTVSGSGTFSSSGSDSFAAITQSGGTINGSGILTLSGAFTQSGGATGGSVDINAATFKQSGGAIVTAGTAVTSSGLQTLRGGTVAGTLDGAGAVTVDSGTTGITGAVTNAASFTLTGGTVNLIGTGSIDTSGNSVIVNAGILRNDGNGIADSDQVSVNGFGVIILTGSETIAGLQGSGSVSLGGHELTVTAQAGDTGTLTIKGAAGADTLSLTLASSLQDFSFAGTTFNNWKGSVDTITVIGNALDNSITGNAKANTLRGGDGLDTIHGGGGKDILEGGRGADVLDGGTGGDTVDYGTSASGVTVTLKAGVAGVGGDAQGDTLAAIENLTGSQSGDTLTGNAIINLLIGNGGADTLSGLGGIDTMEGGAGNDRLIGGGGVDRLTGGADADTFVLDRLTVNRDVIFDYETGIDRIEIDASDFGAGLVAGIALSADQFISNATGTAKDAEDRFVYSTNNGLLYFDADGSGTGERVLIASFRSPFPTLSEADFILV